MQSRAWLFKGPPLPHAFARPEEANQIHYHLMLTCTSAADAVLTCMHILGWIRDLPEVPSCIVKSEICSAYRKIKHGICELFSRHLRTVNDAERQRW